MKRVGITFLLLAIISTISTANDKSVLFLDHFKKYAEGAKLTKPWKCWPEKGAEFRIEGGRLKIKSETTNPTASVKVSNLKDVYLTTRVRNLGGGNWLKVEGPSGWGLMLRLRPKNSCTVTNSNTNFENHIPLGSLLEGKDEHTVWIGTSGNQVKVTLDNFILYSGTQQVSKDWTIGLKGSWKSDLLFDRIRVDRTDSKSFERMGKPLPEILPKEKGTVGQAGKALRVLPVVCTASLKNGPEDFVYHPGETVTFAVSFAEITAENMPVTFRVKNFYEDTVWKSEKTFGKNMSGKAADISVTVPAKGIFRFEVVADRTTVAEVVFGAIAPEIEKREARIDSPFAISPVLDDYHLGLVKKLGASWLRMHDMDLATYWAHVEPARGQFQWRDEQVSKARQKGFYIMGGFEGCPPWASDLPPEVKADLLQKRSDPTIWRKAWGYPPRDLRDVDRYVRETVRHYKDRIKAWEVWNEPHVNLFWKGSVKQYVEMSKVIYRAAHEEDPDCIIVGGGGLSIFSLPWIEEAFQRGLLEYCDVFGVHSYYEDAVETADSEDIRTALDRLKKMMRKYGTVRPLWNTESGITCGSFFTDPELQLSSGARNEWRKSSAGMVKNIVIGIGEGVEKTFCWRFRRWGKGYHVKHQKEGMIEYSGAPKAVYYSYAAMIDALYGLRYARQVDLGKYVRCYVFSDKRASAAVIWTVLAMDRNAKLVAETGERNIHALDIMGNRQSENTDNGKQVFSFGYEPTYLVADGCSAEELGNIIRKAEIKDLYLAEAEMACREKRAREREILTRKKTVFSSAKKFSDEQWFTVDLRKHVNMGFADETPGDGKGGWSDGGPYNDLRDMPLGRRTYCGVPFDIIDPAKNNGKSVITLFSNHLPTMPKSVKSVDVNKKAGLLYFMHSASWARNAGMIAEYTVNYEDGTSESIPIVSGLNAGDWWLAPEESETAHVVPIITYKYTVYRYRIKYLRIMEWKNPHPEKTIKSLELSSQGNAIPIVLAITGA